MMANTKEGTKSVATAVSFSEMFERYLPQYISQCASISENATKLFVHLPKTGGSAIRELLQSKAKRSINIDSYAQLSKWGDIIAEQKENPFDIISGHIDHKALRQMYSSNENIAVITFVREPVARVISQYRYMVTTKYPKHIEFKEKYASFRDFMNNAIPENPMINTLLGPHAGVESALKSAEELFMFIGITEYSSIHSFIVQKCFDFELFHIPQRVNVTEDTEENSLPISEEDYVALREKLWLDIEFYDILKSKHLSMMDDIFLEFYASVAGNEEALEMKAVRT